jgi:uncharacterized membrane protein YdbT with pleckstrin-like domain
MEQLHPGARWVFRMRAYYLLVIIGFIFTAWSFGLLKFILGDSIIGAVIGAVVFYLVFVIGIAEVYSRMSYSRWKYEITKDGVRLEKGIIWKKYTSVPYDRVQNVDLHRGIFARMFGFTTVEIETAGSSGGWGRIRYGGHYGRRRYRSEGHIPAVSIEGAEKIREFIMKKISKRGGAGI